MHPAEAVLYIVHTYEPPVCQKIVWEDHIDVAPGREVRTAPSETPGHSFPAIELVTCIQEYQHIRCNGFVQVVLKF